jgi:hypothetical protein
MGKVIRLTESDLVRLVKRVIKESSGSIKDLHLYYISALQDEMVDNASIFFGHPRVFRAGIYRILEHAKERLSDEEYKKLVEYCEELMNSMTDDKN